MKMEPQRVKAYTFTPGQLYKLLTETVGLYVEYVSVHDYTPQAARTQVALDTAEGLDAEQELADLGEIEPMQMSQVYTPERARDGAQQQGA